MFEDLFCLVGGCATRDGALRIQRGRLPQVFLHFYCLNRCVHFLCCLMCLILFDMCRSDQVVCVGLFVLCVAWCLLIV